MSRFSWVLVTLVGFGVLSLTGCKTTTGWGPPNMFSFWSPKPKAATARSTLPPPPSQSFAATSPANVASSNASQGGYGYSGSQSSTSNPWGSGSTYSAPSSSDPYRTADQRNLGTSVYDATGNSTYGGGAGEYGAGNRTYGGTNYGNNGNSPAAAAGASSYPAYGGSSYGGSPYGGTQYPSGTAGASGSSAYEPLPSSSYSNYSTPGTGTQSSGTYPEGSSPATSNTNNQPATSWNSNGSTAPYQPGSTGRSTNQTFDSGDNVQPATYSGRTPSNY